MDDYTRTNLENWESRVPIHTEPGGYDLQRYLDDPAALSGEVEADVDRLGDLTGLRVVHLQCHLGTDTLSLARLGGEVTGVDFSPSAVAAARDLSERAGPAVRYLEAAIEDVPDLLPETFDLVYTGVGALNWLPSIRRWAGIVRGLLAPGGRLVLRESHPMMDALDDEREDELLVVEYPYFETETPNRWVSPTSYTASDAPIPQPVTHEWNHGLAEVVQALLDEGLRLTHLAEHRALPWKFLPWMTTSQAGWSTIEDRPERLPMMYTLEARRDH